MNVHECGKYSVAQAGLKPNAKVDLFLPIRHETTPAATLPPHFPQ